MEIRRLASPVLQGIESQPLNDGRADTPTWTLLGWISAEGSAGITAMIERWLLTIFFGLHLVWTGLQASIDAGQYKPNALWFCLVTGLLVMGGAFLLRTGKLTAGRWVAGPVVALVFGFYLFCFITAPEDANLRVGLIILASLAEAVVLFLPAAPRQRPDGPPPGNKRAHWRK